MTNTCRRVTAKSLARARVHLGKVLAEQLATDADAQLADQTDVYVIPMEKNGHSLPAKMGRPTKYSEELVNAFLTELVDGASLNELCARDAYPSRNTICRWLNEREDFRDKYRIARELQADILADEVVPIADGEMPTKDQQVQVDGQTVTLPDTPHRVSRDAQRIKARIWKAGRMSPRKWGEDVNDADLEQNGITPSIIVIRSSADTGPGAAPKADRRPDDASD